MYTLLVTKGPDSGLSFEIRAGKVSVGTASDMGLVLTDPTVKPRHFMVTFEEGGWKAITYEPKATIVVDRRWQHPVTKQRGARIFLGQSQILLFAGKIDLATAVSGGEGLDMDAETLRDDVLTQIADKEYQFRHDMLGKAQPVSDDSRKPRTPRGSGRSTEAGGRSRPDRDPEARRDPRASGDIPGVLPAEGSRLFQANAGMMRLPETVEKGRQSAPPKAEAPKSARASWNAPGSNLPAVQQQGGALAKPQMISLTDTAISAMPSSSRDLVVLYDRDGDFASEIRILATRIAEMKGRLGYKSFLVTSVGDGDGKTVLSNNLALAMSEDSERRVALVDANFRSPRAGELFNLDPGRGLLSALGGDRPLSQCVARVLGRNLIVLHAGGEHKNPASVLSSPKFKTLLAELYQAVDFMFVDAPSAIPYADVPLISQHVDAVILVVAANRTPRAALDKVMDLVGRNRIAGLIFVNRRGGAKSAASA